MAVISVFVSSTFRDFNLERDELAGPIRDELNSLVRPLGARVEFIDLRWGIDTSDIQDRDAEQLVLASCAGEIRRCALFLGLIGSRSGWQPSRDALHDALSTLSGPHEELADLSSRLLEQGPMSVTAFEFWLAKQVKEQTELVFVERVEDDGVRGGAGTDIGRRVLPFYASGEFEGSGGFRAVVIEALLPAVKATIDRSGAGGDEYERAAELRWSRLGQVFVGREAIVQQACAAVRDGKRVVLHGDAGVGLSAVWAHCLAQLREEETVWPGVAGLTPSTSSPNGLAQRMLSDQAIAETRPEPEFSLVVAAREQERVVVAIDEGESLRAIDERDCLAMVRRLMDGSNVFTLMTVHDPDDLLVPLRYPLEVIEVPALDGAAVAETIQAYLYPKQLPPEVIATLSAEPRTAMWARLASTALNQIDSRWLTQAQAAEDPARAIRDAVSARVRSLPADLDTLVRQVLEVALHRIAARYNTDPALLYMQVVALAIAPDGLTPDELRMLELGPSGAVAPLLAMLDEYLVEIDELGSVKLGSAAIREPITQAITNPGEVHARLVDLILGLPDNHPRRRWLLYHALRSDRQDTVESVLVQSVDDPESLAWACAQLLDAGAPASAFKTLGVTAPDGIVEFCCAAYWEDLRYRPRSPYCERIDTLLDRLREIATGHPESEYAGEAAVVEMDWLARSERWNELRSRLNRIDELTERLPGDPRKRLLLNRVHQAEVRLLAHEGRYMRAMSRQLVQNLSDGFTGKDPDIDRQLVRDVVEGHYAIARLMEETGAFELAADAALSALRLQSATADPFAERHPTLLIGSQGGVQVVARTSLFHRQDPGPVVEMLANLEPEFRDYVLAPMPHDVNALRLNADSRHLLGQALLKIGESDEGWERIARAWVEACDLYERDQSDPTRFLFIRSNLTYSEYARVWTDRPWIDLVGDSVEAYCGMTRNSARGLEAWILIYDRITKAIACGRPIGVRKRRWRLLAEPGRLTLERSFWDDKVNPSLFELDRLLMKLGERPTPMGRRSARYERVVKRQLVILASSRGIAPSE